MSLPELTKVKPDLDLGDKSVKTLSYLVPFGRGSRSCLGINLAWAGNVLGANEMQSNAQAR